MTTPVAALSNPSSYPSGGLSNGEKALPKLSEAAAPAGPQQPAASHWKPPVIALRSPGGRSSTSRLLSSLRPPGSVTKSKPSTSQPRPGPAHVKGGPAPHPVKPAVSAPMATTLHPAAFLTAPATPAPSTATRTSAVQSGPLSPVMAKATGKGPGITLPSSPASAAVALKREDLVCPAQQGDHGSTHAGATAGQLVVSGIQKKAPVGIKQQAPADKGKEVLLARLKAWRAQRAKALREGPSALLPDSCLQDIAALQPLSILELQSSVSGMGSRKVSALAHEILDIVRGHVHSMAQKQHSTPSAPQPGAAQRHPSLDPVLQGLMVKCGPATATVSEVAVKQSSPTSTIISSATAQANEGLSGLPAAAAQGINECSPVAQLSVVQAQMTCSPGAQQSRRAAPSSSQVSHGSDVSFDIDAFLAPAHTKAGVSSPGSATGSRPKSPFARHPPDGVVRPPAILACAAPSGVLPSVDSVQTSRASSTQSHLQLGVVLVNGAGVQASQVQPTSSSCTIPYAGSPASSAPANGLPAGITAVLPPTDSSDVEHNTCQQLPGVVPAAAIDSMGEGRGAQGITGGGNAAVPSAAAAALKALANRTHASAAAGPSGQTNHAQQGTARCLKRCRSTSQGPGSRPSKAAHHGEADNHADDEGSSGSHTSSDSDDGFDADAFFALPKAPSTGARGSGSGKQRSQQVAGSSRRASTGTHRPSQASPSYQPGRVRIPVLLTPLDSLAKQGGVRMVPAPCVGAVPAATAAPPALQASGQSAHSWGLGPGELSLLYKKNGCKPPLPALPPAASAAAAAPAPAVAILPNQEGSAGHVAGALVPGPSEATSPTAACSTPAVPDLVISSRSRRIARGVSLSDPLLRERNKYSVQEDLFILRSAASRADISATALHLRRSTRALQKRLRRLLLAAPCRVQPGAPSMTWEDSTSLTEAVAAAHTAPHSDLPLNLRASLLEVLVPSSTAVPDAAVGSGSAGDGSQRGTTEPDTEGAALPEGQQQPAAGASQAASQGKKRKRKRAGHQSTEEAPEGKPKTKRKHASGNGPAAKRRAKSPLASAVSALLDRYGLEHSIGTTALPSATCLGSTPRTGHALALAGHLPSQLDQCISEQLQSLMQEAGLTAEQVAGVTAATANLGPEEQRQQLAAVASSCVHAWEVRRVLACAILPSSPVRHLALLRLLPPGPAGITQESVKAAHRQLALVLHPDKQPDTGMGSAGSAAVPAPEVTAVQVNDAWCSLQEARDALLNITSSTCR